MSNYFDVIMYHLFNGGKIKDLEKRFNISKSHIHRILDKARKEGLYNWNTNKNKEFIDKIVENQWESVIKYISSLNNEKSNIVESPKKGYKKVVALPDIHYPENINLKSVEKFLAYYKPDVLIYLGDVIDLRYLSSYDAKNKLIVKDRLRKDYDEVMVMMDLHIKLAQPSEVYFIEGNHEFRVRRFLELFPQGSGFIEIPIGMRLKERGITWVELNKYVKIGDLFYTHGIYVNMYHARKHLECCQRNIRYGHTHTCQLYSGIHPYDSDFSMTAMSVGCLCHLNSFYMKNMPNRWVNALNIAEVEDSGYFADNTVRIHSDGHFRVTGIGEFNNV